MNSLRAQPETTGDMDLDRVWRTAQNDLPMLIARVVACLDNLPQEPTDTSKTVPTG